MLNVYAHEIESPASLEHWSPTLPHIDFDFSALFEKVPLAVGTRSCIDYFAPASQVQSRQQASYEICSSQHERDVCAEAMARAQQTVLAPATSLCYISHHLNSCSRCNSIASHFSPSVYLHSFSSLASSLYLSSALHCYFILFVQQSRLIHRPCLSSTGNGRCLP